MANLFLAILLLLAALRLEATPILNATSCTAPKAYGGNGFCGPAACINTTNSIDGCVLTGKTPSYQDEINKKTKDCTVCTQSSDARCTSAALAATFAAGYATVKFAYCNANYLVIVSSGAPSWTPNLDDVHNPPGAIISGVGCVTRMSSVFPKAVTAKVPLKFVLLATDASNNNIAAFPYGAGDGDGKYLDTSLGTFGLPSGGAVGTTVTGQDIFPFYNNNGLNDAEECNLDSCNEHVGQGGGEPHLHGDPFGSTCLYSAANYTKLDVHPPLIGFSFDGPSIYGRYLSTSAPGYSDSLDNCGGHTHDGYLYHYHTQVVEVQTSAGSGKKTGIAAGTTYISSTPGVYNCWRGNIAAQSAFWNQSNGLTSPCCGMTNYYLSPDMTISPSGTAPPSTGTASPSPSPSLSASYKVALKYTFPLDFNTLVADTVKFAKFKTDIIAGIAAAAGVQESYVTVDSVTAGSVVATTTTTYPASSFTAAQVATATTVTSTPTAVFTAAFLSTYSISVSGIAVSVITSPPPPPPMDANKKVLSTGAIIGIAVGGGVGLLLLIGVLVFCVMRRPAMVGAENPAAAESSKKRAVAENSVFPGQSPELRSPSSLGAETDNTVTAFGA